MSVPDPVPPAAPQPRTLKRQVENISTEDLRGRPPQKDAVRPTGVFFDAVSHATVVTYARIGHGSYGQVFHANFSQNSARPDFRVFLDARQRMSSPTASLGKPLSASDGPAHLSRARSSAHLDVRSLARTLMPLAKRSRSPNQSPELLGPEATDTPWRHESTPVTPWAAFTQINCIYKRFTKDDVYRPNDDDVLEAVQHEYFSIIHAALCMGAERAAESLIVPRTMIVDRDTLKPAEGRTPEEEVALAAQAPLLGAGIVFPYEAGSMDALLWVKSVFHPSWKHSNRLGFWNVVLEVSAKMFEALGRLHSVGVIHMDVKLQNYILSHSANGDDFKVRLIDFGLAQIFPRPEIAALGIDPDRLCEFWPDYADVIGSEENVDECRGKDKNVMMYLTTPYMRDSRTMRADKKSGTMRSVRHTMAAAKEHFPHYDVFACALGCMQLVDPPQTRKPWPTGTATLVVRNTEMAPPGFVDILLAATGTRATRPSALECAHRIRTLRSSLNAQDELRRLLAGTTGDNAASTTATT